MPDDLEYDEPGPDGLPDRNAGVYRAGTLTARELRDLDNIREWRQLASGEFAGFSGERGIFSGNVVEVRTGRYNAKTELRTAEGETVYAARSDVSGKAYLVIPEKYIQSELYVSCGLAEKKLGSTTEPVVFTQPGGEDPKQLDLMLMIDTTGSMGDELEYLKAELEDMVTRVAQQGNYLDIRISVNFYRDEGDDYVVKYFDFRGDVSECVQQLRAQYANGGGDYPEAVHTALDNAVNGHEWRDEAVKLCFFVLDAPPHTESEVQGITEKLNSGIRTASEKGIRLIPVASSGVDKETEFILRSFSVMTGGTYIYLTDHSGIGGGHVEATTSKPGEVEPLNDCMVRVICEFCGLEVPEPVDYDVKQNKESATVYQLDAIDKTGASVATDEVAELRTLLEKLDYRVDKVCDCLPTLRFAFSNGEIYEIKYHDGVCDGICVFDGAGVLLQAECTEKAAVLIETVYSQAYPGAEGFGFAIGWGIYSDSTYDSRTGRLVKSHFQPDIADYTATLVLSEEQLAAVKEILDRLDLESYPAEFTPYDDIDSTVMEQTIPYETIKIVMYDGPRAVSVCCNEIALFGEKAYSEKTKAFFNAAQEITRIITASPEWQSLRELVNLHE
ncbi:MAG: VWA domain-containing protein [Clostridia bacterium]|nr:VWA domain-containing protein [Clostridia bacterium]